MQEFRCRYPTFLKDPIHCVFPIFITSFRMIDKVMDLLRTETQEHIRNRAQIPSNETVVELNSFINAEGKVAIGTDKIGLSLFNIDEERVMKTPGRTTRNVDGRVEYIQPEVRLNLYVIFAANFTTYSEGLKHLSYLIGYFQKKRVISHANTPLLDPRLSELAVDLYTMTLEQQNYLWSIIGGKYLPSVAYQVRPVLIQDDEVEHEAKPVLEMQLRDQPIQPKK